MWWNSSIAVQTKAHSLAVRPQTATVWSPLRSTACDWIIRLFPFGSRLWAPCAFLKIEVSPSFCPSALRPVARQTTQSPGRQLCHRRLSCDVCAQGRPSTVLPSPTAWAPAITWTTCLKSANVTFLSLTPGGLGIVSGRRGSTLWTKIIILLGKAVWLSISSNTRAAVRGLLRWSVWMRNSPGLPWK